MKTFCLFHHRPLHSRPYQLHTTKFLRTHTTGNNAQIKKTKKENFCFEVWGCKQVTDPVELLRYGQNKSTQVLIWLQNVPKFHIHEVMTFSKPIL